MLFPAAWEGGSTPDMIHVVHDLRSGSWEAQLFDVHGHTRRARTKPLRTAGSDLEALRKLNDARPVASPRR